MSIFGFKKQLNIEILKSLGSNTDDHPIRRPDFSGVQGTL